jgi:signal peptidase I
MRRFEVADRSMVPAFQPGDYVVAVRRSDPAPGDVVVFEHEPGFHLIKRVVAVAGDVVQVDGDRLLTPHAPPVPIPSQAPARWSLEAGEVFVLSDAAMSTRADSRTFGPVDGGSCLRVVLRYWPAGRIRRFAGQR